MSRVFRARRSLGQVGSRRHTSGLRFRSGMVFGILVIILIAGAVFTTYRMEQGTQNSGQSMAAAEHQATATAQAQSDITEPTTASSSGSTSTASKADTPKTATGTTKVSSPSATTNSSNSQAPTTCDPTMQHAVWKAYNQALTAENDWHDKIIRSITNTVMQVLNPGQYSQKLTDETTRHTTALQDLLGTRNSQLDMLGCQM